MANTYIFANNAGSTLAGSISNTALSLNLQAGGGALFPNPTTGQIFTITAVDAATGLLREIMWCTARSADTLTIVRAQEGTTALNWSAGDLIQELWTAGQAGAMVQLSGAGTTFVGIVPQTTFFVNSSTGSDTTGDGLSTGTAWLTLGHAVSVLATYNLGGQTITVQMANTGVIYPGPATFSPPSNGTIIIRGDPANKANYTVSRAAATSNSVMGISTGSATFNGMIILNNTGSGSSNVVQCINGGNLTLQNVTLETAVNAVGNLIGAGSGGQVTVLSGCAMAGSAAVCWSSNEASIFMGASVAISGSLAFSTCLVTAAFGGIIVDTNSSFVWTGTTPTCVRFISNTNGIISSGTGVPNTFWPGTTNGSTATQGQSL